MLLKQLNTLAFIGFASGSADIVNDQYENTSRHFAIAKDQSLMAYGRITNLGKGIYQLSQIVVSPQERSKVTVRRCYKP